ncbi:hypothetical protein CLU79DRAFT_794475 [Phycomyces nitens]|nr:hypothetical protein CLU79DRAFT_794475 [Phycomyces nitens]
MGSVQRLCKISCEGGRILSIKLRANLLVTLNEDNCVRLYEYSTSNGFQLQIKWTFGDVSQPANVVECIDILPEINILVVALRGSKCMFYDINKKNPREPIQVLKGGSHPSFVPDSIALSQDYFAVLGRKPSALFVWHWRKGVRLANKAFDNQPHSVYLSDHHVMTVSVDGIAHAFDILDQTKPAVPHTLPPCSMPSVDYDGSLSMVLAPFQSRRIHHFQWTPLQSKNTLNDNLLSLLPTQSISTPHSSPPSPPSPPSPRRNLLPSLLSRHKKKEKEPRDPLLMRLRRHSSYNDYGYACQMRTANYIKQHPHSTTLTTIPDFSHKPALIHSIRTSPLERTALEIINVTTHNGRVATLNRHGDIAVYALNGTTAARVTLVNGECSWIEPAAEHSRQDDRLSDGYDFVRSRLAIGPMGIVYGGREGDVWWMDFGCRPDA